MVLKHIILWTTSANPTDLAPSFLGREKKEEYYWMKWNEQALLPFTGV